MMRVSGDDIWEEREVQCKNCDELHIIENVNRVNEYHVSLA